MNTRQVKTKLVEFVVAVGAAYVVGGLLGFSWPSYAIISGGVIYGLIRAYLALEKSKKEE